jgi:hypothetical protein
MAPSTASADSSYTATLETSLTVSGFLDAERNPISKPAGLTIENIITFFDDSFVVVEGDATASADGGIDVVADDPFDLVAGDRFNFDAVVSGTTVFPTGFSYASAFGSALIVAENGSPDPVTISFDFDYEYAASTSVDDPELEQAYVILDYELFLDVDQGPVFELFVDAYNNESLANFGAGSFEVTLLPGEFSGITAVAGVTGDPSGVPEPKSWQLSAIGAALFLGRRSVGLARARARS